MLGAEGGEGGEGVGDAEEGGGVVVYFEVGGALGDELEGVSGYVVGGGGCLGGERTAAGSSSRSILRVDVVSRVDAG